MPSATDNGSRTEFKRYDGNYTGAKVHVYFVPEKKLVCIRNADDQVPGRLKFYIESLREEGEIWIPAGKSACMDEAKHVMAIFDEFCF